MGDLYSDEEKEHSPAYNEALRQALADARAATASMTELLENLHIGVIQLHRTGRIIAANDRAVAILRMGDVVTDKGGFLSARRPTDQASLLRLLECAMPLFDRPGAAGSMVVKHPLTLSGKVLHVVPVNHERAAIRPRTIAALVLISDPTFPVHIDPALVSKALGLTATEGALASALAAGQTLHEIARETDRSERTLYWHLARIFRKQGISRQVDLVRRVLSLAGVPSSRR